MAKYGRSASKRVESAMRRKKKGTLKSGSGRSVKSRKQAIAIGLNEARRKGAKCRHERARANRLRARAPGKARGKVPARNAERVSAAAITMVEFHANRGTSASHWPEPSCETLPAMGPSLRSPSASPVSFGSTKSPGRFGAVARV